MKSKRLSKPTSFQSWEYLVLGITAQLKLCSNRIGAFF